MKWDADTIARAESLLEAGVDRHAVAERMSALVGEPISPSAVENRIRQRGSRPQNKLETGCKRPQRANGRPGWTEEMVSFAQHAWNVDGLTQTQIAERMSAKFGTRITRNGVGGMIDRLRYAGVEFKPRSRKPPPPPKRAAVVNGGAVMASIKAKREMDRKPPPAPIPVPIAVEPKLDTPIDAEPMLYHQLGSDQCLWRVNSHAESRVLCCAAPTEKGHAFCPEHRKRAWREPRR